MQEKKNEISKLYMHVNIVRSHSNKARQMIDAKHGIYYQNASVVAAENDIPVNKPHVCMIQVNSENYDMESISDYSADNLVPIFSFCP